MINWFDMPAEGLSNGGQFEIKELTATENKVYEKAGEVYNKVTVNVEGGGGSSYDLIITADKALIDSATSFTLTEGSVTDAYNKIIAGEYVKVLIIGDGSGTPPQEMAIYESWRVMTTSTEGNLEVVFFNYNNNGSNNLTIDENGNVSM